MSEHQVLCTPIPDAPVYRPFTFGVTRAVRRCVGEMTYLRCDQELRAFPQRMTDRLLHWATTAREQPLYAQRDPARGGEWRYLRYGQALQAARSIGQALLDRGCGRERPLVILCANSLEHAMLALGAMFAGVPFCAVSPAYSLVSQDFDKLRHVLQTLTPGLVYAADREKFRRAIEAVVTPDIEVVVDAVPVADERAGRPLTALSDLLATAPTPMLEEAMQATGPDTIVKFLFTSGSTRLPKAVINTQRMICANQQQLRQSIPFLEQEPPVLVDWLPWNHTAGGNHDFYMALFNGGTLYIDEGRPTPILIGETLRNLREIAPTWFFNVPVGYEAMVRAMDTDPVLRRNFFSRLRQMLYSGAALAQPIRDALYAHAESECGERIVMTAGLGMTESSPFALFVTTPHALAGDVGLPAAGLEVKLVTVGTKLEVRYRGPNVTPGYWRNLDATREAFDEEGFFCTGDAVAWIDPENIHLGLRFDGRIAENFKLSSGTFVSVGPLRGKVIAAGAPYVQDVVLTGLNMNEIGALVSPTPALRALANLPARASLHEVAAAAPVTQWLQGLVDSLAPIGHRQHRSALVAALYAGSAPHIAVARA